MNLRRELFGDGMKQLVSRLDLCLWPEENCNEKAIRAHSVQNSMVLDALCCDGHVVMPTLDVTFSKCPAYVFRKVGRNMATTFTGLCSKHDQELFRAIEINGIDVADPEHLFLLAYRAVLREAHTVRKSAIDTQSTYLLGAERGLYPRDESSAPEMLAVELMMSAYMVEQEKAELDRAYRAQDWGRIKHEVVRLRAPPTVAVNSMFTTERWSEQTNQPAYVMLNVFPSNGWTIGVFSSLREHNHHVREAFSAVLTSSGHYQQYEMSKLILRKCENLVLAPALYHQFGLRQRRAIVEFFERNSAGHSLEMDDPTLFLFAAIAD
jgi:hypothetical protein